jgi:spermidine synthase
MSDPTARSANTTYRVLILLCAGSGCAALIYQVVWFQLLSLVIGASSVSLGVVLGTFMGGMCIGSLAVWRFVSRQRNPLLVFAGIEFGIGLFGLLLLAGIPAINDVYAAFAQVSPSGMTGLALRATVAGVCLLPPTILMGATLPSIARFMQTSPQGVARMGLCYGANIFGAVAGSLLAGFYLLRHYDVSVATFIAVAVNIGVAGCSLLLASTTRPSSTVARSVDDEPKHDEQKAANWPVYIATALSGMTALSAEVIWTRQLSLLLGATVYTFSLVLAVFLFGLGLGSGVGSVASRRLNPRLALGSCQ